MAPQSGRRQENLAFLFQELLTVGERLRANRQQASDPLSFRAQLWAGVKQAEDEARRRGYSAEDVEMAVFAVVAFLDESILNSRLPAFADWPRQPLQEERYGHHNAGEIFFQNLQKLGARADSQELADLLELYCLCLLLGFAGRYSLGTRGELRAMAMQTGERIQRIRGSASGWPLDWALPSNEAGHAPSADPWVVRLAIAAGAAFLLALVLFVVFYFSLEPVEL